MFRCARFSRFVSIACIALCPMVHADDPAPTLTSDQAQRELRILKRGLTGLHAGLYRYQTAEQF